MRKRLSAVVAAMIVLLGFVCIILSNLFIVMCLEGENVWMGGSERSFVREVNSTVQSVNVTINAHRISIPYFNTSGNTVSIAVLHDQQVILNLSQVSGERIEGRTHSVYSVENPPQYISAVAYMSWYYIILFWEGIDAKVSFTCQAYTLVHADYLVTVTKPSYYIYSTLGYSLVGIGILGSVLIIYLSYKGRVRND